MVNACFRCKSAISSGGTFCDDCRRTVSLDLSYTSNSRWWVVVAAAPVLLALLVVGRTLSVAVAGSAPPVVSLFSWFAGIALVVAFGCAVYTDAKHVRRRDDTDWNPSLLAYAILAVGSVLLVVPTVPVAAYHLYRRKRTVGLHLGRSG